MGRGCNGFGHIKLVTTYREQMEMFDALPRELRRFADGCDAKLSMSHFIARFKRAMKKGRSMDQFILAEEKRLFNLLKPKDTKI
jgi:hypothetical protein